ncbi:ubiquinol-cytochrome C reductase, partial [Vibrio parahaemolyticus 901128]
MCVLQHMIVMNWVLIIIVHMLQLALHLSCYIFLIIVTQSASDGIMAYWLFKTEPDTFSIDTLRTQKVSCWEGVRNYQARNMMRDQVKVGDFVLIYHSSCKNVGVAGIAKVVREAYPDHFQFDPESDY